MTNLNKIYAFYNVHSHNQQEVLKELLNNHLPYGYTYSVIARLKKENVQVDSALVRMVKYGKTKNIAVFNAIVEVAAAQKALQDRLNKNLKTAI